MNNFIECVGGDESLYGLQPVKSSVKSKDSQLSQCSTLDSLILDVLPPDNYEFHQPVCNDNCDASENVNIFMLGKIRKLLQTIAGLHIPEVRLI